MKPLSYLREELDRLAAHGLLRERGRTREAGELSFSTNDYLGLADEPQPMATPSGAGAARLLAGDRPPHRALEAELAAWLGTEDALLFSSGYAANLGLVSALAGPGDLIVSDALNHASLVDGCRLSRARVEVVPHLDSNAVERALATRAAGARAWVLTESYFSMDADGPDPAALTAICERHGAALLIDEAHALGVFGPEGRGLWAASSSRPDALVGGFGKAFGLSGGFVAGSRDLIAWLLNRARSFVFSTGTSPAIAAAAIARLRRLRTDRSPAERVHALSQQLRSELAPLGLDVRGHGPVVPIVLGSAARALAVSAHLAQAGLIVPAIRPPTVPEGTARLRVALTARHSEADVARLTSALAAAPSR